MEDRVPDDVSLSPRLKSLSLEHCHLQGQSPLYGVLPPELRNEIFALALAEDEDPAKPYPRESYYRRPGFGGPGRVHVALLQTCGRIWLETRALPLRNLETPFWLGAAERRPPEYCCPHRNARQGESNHPFQSLRYCKFISHHWRSIQHIRFFPQLYTFRAETFRRFFSLQTLLRPTELTITIRYTDWWWWENDARLQLNSDDFRKIRLPASVNKVVMELETMERKRRDLETVTANILNTPQRWRFVRQDGVYLEVEAARQPNAQVKEWRWNGPTKFDNKVFPHHPPSEETPYIVKVLTWAPERPQVNED